jgi:hypothetical protein
LLSNFTGLDYNSSGGYVPPDSCGAAGPASYLETVNQSLAIYSPRGTGSINAADSFADFWYGQGALPQTDFNSSLSDPIVIYDELAGRFIIGDQDVDSNSLLSNFDIAVSKSSNPASLSAFDWNFYQINTTEPGFDADYPGNFGYNHDAFVFTLNMYSSYGYANHALVTSVDASDLVNGVSQAQLHYYSSDVTGFSLRPTTMHDSVAGDPMWLISEHGDNASIDVIKMTGVLSSSPTFTPTNLAVRPYATVVYPRNPDGTVITSNIDSRILKAAEANQSIVATHAVSISSTEDVAQWYRIDVSSGSPVLADQGRVGLGQNTYVYYPGIDINPAGDIGMSYMRSGTDYPSDYMSMYVTGRTPADPRGMMEQSVPIPFGGGRANYSDFTGYGRAGDLSGINVDPTDGSFWAVNEFANLEPGANWGTAVANFALSLGGTNGGTYFDGADDTIDYGNVGNFGTADFTISFFIQTTSTRPEGILGKRAICNHSSFLDIRIGRMLDLPNGIPGHLVVELDQDAAATNYNLIISNRAINDGQLHKVVVARRGPTVYLGIDSVLDSVNSTIGVTNISNSADLIAGASCCTGVSYDGTNYFTGILANVTVNGQVLTGTQTSGPDRLVATSEGTISAQILLVSVDAVIAAAPGDGSDRTSVSVVQLISRPEMYSMNVVAAGIGPGFGLAASTNKQLRDSSSNNEAVDALFASHLIDPIGQAM